MSTNTDTMQTTFSLRDGVRQQQRVSKAPGIDTGANPGLQGSDSARTKTMPPRRPEFVVGDIALP